MTTKEMIDTLRYKANNIKAKIESEFFNEVADKLEKQIGKDTNVTSKNDEWISVDDMLPENAERYKGRKVIDVLVTTEKGLVTKVQRQCYRDSWSWGRIFSRVVAWMPLPKAYKIEK
jgi:hypothetical protein